MPDSTQEVHALEPSEFLEEVHSFEFWFQSVEGYLSGRPYGHHEMEEPEIDEAQRDRLITTLCNYCVGELAALEGASGLILFAPNREAKIFLATQVVDEARHLEVLYHRLQAIGVSDPEGEIERRAAHPLKLFKRRLLELVASKDWEAALFAQNVILEAMEFAAFQTHARRTDPVTREVLEGIIKDERRHMGFGENEIGRCLARAPHVRSRLGEVKKELDYLVLETFSESVADLGIERSEQTDLGRLYLAAVERLGFTND
ncbi:MAG: long-chain fatty aldehyde decarbonylase [Deltaproteobacteria bacterium]|nr:long-chain fatty aldehyde decarbonylase [Deltaproteobacteria bacterium]MBW2413354.1 long-chain fatty aldehyde decarbonylase [Deltaproteobacteria bacterium]